MSQRICVWCDNGNAVYTAAPALDGVSPCSEPNPADCPCENLLNAPNVQAQGVTQVYTSFHPDPNFSVVPQDFNPCTQQNATICYTCNNDNSGYLSQTLINGGPCPSGWSNSIPTCGESESDPTNPLCPPPAKGCDVCYSEQCASDGSLEVTITFGQGLNNVQVQIGSQNMQISQGCTSPDSSNNPFTVTVLPGDLLSVSGYCSTPSIIDEWNKERDGGDAPSWGAEECGDATVSSTTKIVCFYDTTSLGAPAQASMYNAANEWIKTIQTDSGFTGEVYHVAIGGERWVMWPAWLLDNTVDIDGINRTNLAAACGVNTPSSNWDAGESVLPAWNSDANAYVQATGSQGNTKAMPAQITAGEDVLVIIFADESADQPNAYTVTGTGPASGGGGGQGIGGYHGRNSADNNNAVITHADSIYDIVLPSCISATGNTNNWNLWELDYNIATPIIAAHNAGSGNIRTFVYPSQPTTGSIGTARRPFPFHVWASINSGYNNTGLLQNGSSAPTCQIADLSNLVQNGGGTLVNWYVQNNVGRLDQYGFGANVECKAFTALDFAADLDAFLSLNNTTCDNTDCAAIRVVTESGVGIDSEPVTINGINMLTDGQGYTTLVSGLVGGVDINGCLHNFTGDCSQYLFEITKIESTHTAALTCVLGCTDPTAINYNPNANVDDGSCEYCVWGCTNPLSLNYDPAATCDDGSCQVLPDIVECTLINMSKEILKQCHDECGDVEAYKELLADYREMEAILAQIYMLIECDKTAELQALMPKILRLMEKYQCDSCYEFQGTSGDTTTTQDETSATTCGAELSGPCTNKMLIPSVDALQIGYQLNGGATVYASTSSNTVLGDITGNTVDVTSYCGPTQVIKTLNACGLESIPNDANVYCFYDVTSTCVEDIQKIVNAVELWYKSKVIADPTYTGDVYHLPVHGEKWLRCAEYPIDQLLHSMSLRLVNGSGNALGGGNKGFSTTLTVDVLDRSTIGTTHTMVTQTMYGPKAGPAVYNDIATGTGALPYLRPGGSYADQGTASGGASDDKAVVLCFFDEVEGNQGGGPYHDRGHAGDGSYGYCPTGVIEDFGNAPRAKWKTDYDSFVDKHQYYSFFKGFLYPVIPGIHVSSTDCASSYDANNAPSYNTNAYANTGKMFFVLNALAGIHKGVWNTATDGPVPINPVIAAAAHPGNATVTAGTLGNLNAITLAANPYVAQGYDGLSDYGWSMDATVGTPGTNSIAGVFTSGQFNNTLDSLLSGGSNCNGTDCLTVIVKDADTGAVINDTYTKSAVTVQPGVHQILDPSSNVTVTTAGECTEYVVTLFKDVMDQYTDCVLTTAITCGCGGDPSIVLSVGAQTQITGVTTNGETKYGTIKNETTGVEDDIIFDPDVVGPLTGSITLDKTLKNSSFFKPNTELPDGRYKITLDSVGGKKKELCFLILCDSYAKLLDAFERYTLQIDCCPTCTSPEEKYLEAYSLYRALKVAGIDCGLEPWIDKNIKKLQACCSACGADADCNQNC